MNTSKEQALEALLTCTTMDKAAQKCGLTTRTLYNYLNKDNEFRRRYDEGKAALVSKAVEKLQKRMAVAIESMSDIVDDEEVPANIRIQAARGILDYAMKLTETQDIIKRLEALEGELHE